MCFSNNDFRAVNVKANDLSKKYPQIMIMIIMLIVVHVTSVIDGCGQGKLRFNPDSKVREANMGPILARQDPYGPHLCPLNLAIRVITLTPYMVLPLFATRFVEYAGGIRVSFIQPRINLI